MGAFPRPSNCWEEVNCDEDDPQAHSKNPKGAGIFPGRSRAYLVGDVVNGKPLGNGKRRSHRDESSNHDVVGARLGNAILSENSPRSKSRRSHVSALSLIGTLVQRSSCVIQQVACQETKGRPLRESILRNGCKAWLRNSFTSFID